MPKLSIIIPVYNVKQYIRECIDSVLSQTYHDFEIILVDDGSSDGSEKICDEYANNYRNIKVIHQKNSGHIVARTNGVINANGEYIGFLDSDDWVDNTMFEKLMQKSLEYDCDIVVCDMYIENPHNRGTYSQRVAPGFYDEGKLKSDIYPCMLYLKEKCGFGISPSFVNKIFKKDLILSNMKNVSNKIRVGEDVAAINSSLLDAKRFYYLNEYLYHYRSVENSITRKHDNMYFERLEILSDYLYKISKEKNIFDLGEQIDYYRLYLYAQGILCELICDGDRNEIISCIKKQQPIIKKLLKHSNIKYFEKNVRFVLFLVSNGFSNLCYFTYRLFLKIKKRGK